MLHNKLFPEGKSYNTSGSLGNRKSCQNSSASPTPRRTFCAARSAKLQFSSLLPDFSRLHCNVHFWNARRLYKWQSEPARRGSNSNASTRNKPRSSKVPSKNNLVWSMRKTFAIKCNVIFLRLIKLKWCRLFWFRFSMVLMLKSVFFCTEGWLHSKILTDRRTGRGKHVENGPERTEIHQVMCQLF